jgi:hypothetical protein
VLYFVRVKALVIDGVIRYAILVSFDITEEHEKRKLREREHALLAALEPVNRILLSAPVADPKFERLLMEILTLFECDRAFLGYPCDPKASEFSIVYEQTRPEFRREPGLTLPMDAMLARHFEVALSQHGGVVRHHPVRFGAEPLSGALHAVCSRAHRGGQALGAGHPPLPRAARVRH